MTRRRRRGANRTPAVGTPVVALMAETKRAPPVTRAERNCVGRGEVEAMYIGPPRKPHCDTLWPGNRWRNCTHSQNIGIRLESSQGSPSGVLEPSPITVHRAFGLDRVLSAAADRASIGVELDGVVVAPPMVESEALAWMLFSKPRRWWTRRRWPPIVVD